jgi:hypothetical protein
VGFSRGAFVARGRVERGDGALCEPLVPQRPSARKLLPRGALGDEAGGAQADDGEQNGRVCPHNSLSLNRIRALGL